MVYRPSSSPHEKCGLMLELNPQVFMSMYGPGLQLITYTDLDTQYGCLRGAGASGQFGGAHGDPQFMLIITAIGDLTTDIILHVILQESFMVIISTEHTELPQLWSTTDTMKESLVIDPEIQIATEDIVHLIIVPAEQEVNQLDMIQMEEFAQMPELAPDLQDTQEVHEPVLEIISGIQNHQEAEHQVLIIQETRKGILLTEVRKDQIAGLLKTET